jgi:DMSO/TMAO reductase YedYZ molybdopterin-dependent catalytic subunit
MDDALHPQTLLAYAMNGPDMPIDHGAPLRLKVSRQLGYKSLKYLSKITVTNTAKGIRDGLGSWSPAGGYSWYAGIYKRAGDWPLQIGLGYCARTAT